MNELLGECSRAGGESERALLDIVGEDTSEASEIICVGVGVKGV